MFSNIPIVATVIADLVIGGFSSFVIPANTTQIESGQDTYLGYSAPETTYPEVFNNHDAFQALSDIRHGINSRSSEGDLHHYWVNFHPSENGWSVDIVSEFDSTSAIPLNSQDVGFMVGNSTTRLILKDDTVSIYRDGKAIDGGTWYHGVFTGRDGIVHENVTQTYTVEISTVKEGSGGYIAEAFNAVYYSDSLGTSTLPKEIRDFF